MASDAQDALYRIYAAVAGNGGTIGALTIPGTAGEGITGSIQSLFAIAGGALPSAVAGVASEGSAGGAAKTALRVLTSGFGLAPLATMLFGLFGGGGEDTPPPLTKYVMPPRIDLAAAEADSGMAGVDYGQNGLPRSWAPVGSTAAPQIQVTVQAMDARSFLDRSNDIAAAVRDAMLNLNSINDVVNEL